MVDPFICAFLKEFESAIGMLLLVLLLLPIVLVRPEALPRGVLELILIYCPSSFAPLPVPAGHAMRSSMVPVMTVLWLMMVLFIWSQRHRDCLAWASEEVSR